MRKGVERDEVRKGSWGQTGCLSELRLVFSLRAVEGFSAAAGGDRLPAGPVEARRPVRRRRVA